MSLLVLVGGVPGSGKTYIASMVGEGVREAVFLDKDTVARPFTEKVLSLAGASIHDRESLTYLHEARPLEYRTLMDVALQNLGIGKKVICTAPFLREFRDPDWNRDVELFAMSAGAQVVRIWIHAGPELARERIIQRGAGRDEWKLSHWDDYLRSTPHEPPVLDNLIVIDNDGVPEEDLKAAVAELVQEVAEW